MALKMIDYAQKPSPMRKESDAIYLREELAAIRRSIDSVIRAVKELQPLLPP